MRMLGQDNFQVLASKLLDAGSVSVDDHSLGGDEGAREGGFIHSFDFHDAKATALILCIGSRAFQELAPEVNSAVSFQSRCRGQVGVGAQSGDIDTGALRCF